MISQEWKREEAKHMNWVHTSILLCPEDDVLSKNISSQVYEESPNKQEHKKMQSKVSKMVHQKLVKKDKYT